MRPPTGSVAVKFHPEVGLAVYVQDDEGARVVWSGDMLNAPGVMDTLITGRSIAEYGDVVYEPAAGHGPSNPHPADWS